MAISVSEWRKVRHESAEGSGVAGGIEKWAKLCVDPETLDVKSQAKAIEAAELFLKALETARGKLAPDAKLVKKRNELKKTNPTEPKKKVELSKLESQVEGDARKVEATRELIKDWEAQVSKYIRAAMKSEDNTALALENHKSEVKTVLEHYVSISKIVDSGKTEIEDGDAAIQKVGVKAEKLLVSAIKAKRSGDTMLLETITSEVKEYRVEAEGLKSKTEVEVRKYLAAARKIYAEPDPWMKDPLTNEKLKVALRKNSDKATQDIDILEETLPTLEDSVLQVEVILKKIDSASSEGFDMAQEIESSLERMVDRLNHLLHQVNSVVELGVGGSIEQAGLELINLGESKDIDPEARAQIWDGVKGKLQFAGMNMPKGEKVLSQAKNLIGETREIIPKNTDQLGSGARESVEEIRAMEKTYDGYVRAHAANIEKLKKHLIKFKTMPRYLPLTN